MDSILPSKIFKHEKMERFTGEVSGYSPNPQKLSEVDSQSGRIFLSIIPNYSGNLGNILFLFFETDTII